MISNRLTTITKANAQDGSYSGTYFQMTRVGFDRILDLTTPDSPMRSWFGGASISYLTGISVALLEDMPDNMWRLVNVNTGVVIEEGFIEDEPSLSQKSDEGRTATENPSGSD
jgi:hypothetical protein